MEMAEINGSCEENICRLLKQIEKLLKGSDQYEIQEQDHVKPIKEREMQERLDETLHNVAPYLRYLFNTTPLLCSCARNTEDDPRLILKRLMTLPLDEGSTRDTSRDQVVVQMVEIGPQLIINCDENGQTALHIAVLQENGQDELRYRLLQKMIDKIPEVLGKTQFHNGETLLANGPMFQGTKMEAGTVLGVAALSTSKNKLKVFNKLLKVGFYMYQKTKSNNNILHSIIRHRHRNREADVLKSTMQIVKKCIFRSDDINTYRMLTDVNTACLTPVAEAAKYGDFQMYEFFMTTKAMRRNVWSDGLMYVHKFDVTEIETIQPPKENINSHQNQSAKEESKAKHKSVLEFVGHGHNQIVANEFVQFSPIKEVIRCKWLYYRWFVLTWYIFHFLSTVSLCATGYYRAKFLSNDASCLTCGSDNGIRQTAFRLTISELIIGVLYLFPLCCEIGRLFKRRYTVRPSFSHAYSNLLFKRLFRLFGLLIVVDACLALTDFDIPILPFVLVIACYMFLFFFQVIYIFSAFTVIIQKIIPDMLRFAFVMTTLLSGFSMAMFFVMHGADPNDDSFDRFDKSSIKMVSIMIGLGEVDNLFTSRYPIVAISIFILFVLLTTIMLLNSLIAIMSNTCSLVMTAQRGGFSVYYEHCNLQKLSVILYIEHICIFDCLLVEVGNMESSNFFTGKRRLLKIGTVSDVTADSEESPSTSLTTQMFSFLFTTRKTATRQRENKRVKPGNDMPSKSFGTTLKTLEITELEGTKCSYCGK